MQEEIIAAEAVSEQVGMIGNDINKVVNFQDYYKKGVGCKDIYRPLQASLCELRPDKSLEAPQLNPLSGSLTRNLTGQAESAERIRFFISR